MAEAGAKKVLSQILLPSGYFQPNSFAVAVQTPPYNNKKTADVSLALLNYLLFILQK